MNSDFPELNYAGTRWAANAEALFSAIKTANALGNTWAFRLDGVDDVPVDVDPAELLDPQGSAAFMLRRIQALRYLIRMDRYTDKQGATLAAGYTADLLQYFGTILASTSLDPRFTADFERAETLTTELLGALVVRLNE